MNLRSCEVAVLTVALACGGSLAQAPPAPETPATAAPGDAGAPAVPLDWAPAAWAQLSAGAAAKSSFTLDANMLRAAANLSGNLDDETRQAIAKVDGVSVHLLRFGEAAAPDPVLVGEIRDAYHLRGWKHVITTESGGSPVHNDTTDVWVVMQGVNLRGAVVLVAGAKTVTLVTVAGNLSPADLLHLRGHFGIPKFDADGLGNLQ